MSDSSENPVTMPEGLAETKKNLKRRALVDFVIWMLIPLSIGGFMTWVYGFGEQLRVRPLDQLQVVRGEYYVRQYYKTLAASYESALSDPKTGQSVFRGEDALCKILPYRHNYVGKPANVWYATRGAGPVNWIYQLEVDGRLVCTLDQTNAEVPVFNGRVRKSILLFGLGWLMFSGLLGLCVSYIYYRDRLKKFLEQQE
jgi:hypothetical protein